MTITPEQKKAYEKFEQAGRELFLAMKIDPLYRDIARELLRDEDIQDWIDDDIFVAALMYQELQAKEEEDAG